MLGGAAGAVGASFAAAFTPLIVAVLAGRIGRAKPALLSAGSGTILPELISASLTVAFGLLLTGAGLIGIVMGPFEVKFAGACGIAMGLPIALFMSPSLTRIHAVHWTDQGVEGPSSLFGLTLGLARTFIPWSEIATTGETKSGYWYVESETGQRVYWSYLYRGHQALGDAIAAHCPGVRRRRKRG